MGRFGSRRPAKYCHQGIDLRAYRKIENSPGSISPALPK